MTNKKPFPGDGFPRVEFTEAERAEMRHMGHEIKRVYPTIEGIDEIVRGGFRLAKVVSVMGAIGVCIAVLIKTGVFQ